MQNTQPNISSHNMAQQVRPQYDSITSHSTTRHQNTTNHPGNTGHPILDWATQPAASLNISYRGWYTRYCHSTMPRSRSSHHISSHVVIHLVRT
eukprot:755942-Pyramimonas_sp.AAC.1